MPQVINTNIGSLIAQRNLETTQQDGLTALQRLSSGLRINSARDDAAGLAISTRFTAQVRGLGVAIRNAGDGISLAQTAEGALGAMTEGLQRIRELALQSSNATNSDSDRAALNAEAQQLISELRRVSDQTNFNGRKLLDGSFSSSVQIGTQVGEVVEFSISEVTAENLGGGIGAGVSARGTDNALGNGDLIINGVAIGPSQASDDVSSTDNAGASAISKAAAINRSTDETGVSAQVNANTVAGVDQSATAAAAQSGAILINDVSISIATGTASKSANRAAVVEAINAKSDQTGVVAVDTGTDVGGVILESVDGRNIQIDDSATSGLTAAVTGLNLSAGASVTYEGGYTLVAEDGNDISISGGDGTGNGDLANSGLSAGSYNGTSAAITSTTDFEAAAVAAVDNSLSAGDLVINGVSIGASKASDDTATDTTSFSSDAAGSAIALAAAINRASEQTGVTAVVGSTTVNGGSTTAASTGDAGTIMINGVESATVTTTGDVEADRATAIDAINAVSGQSGVVASDNGTSITLTAADGRNISVGLVTGDATFADAIGLDDGVDGIATIAANTDFDDGSETTYGQVTLESASAITIESGSGGDAGVTSVGFTQGTFGGATDGQFLSELDISTVEGSEKALSALDNALDSVNRERANLGAIQNRLDSTITSLAINVENLSAARSRILDADFASETAEFSRTQVLQQAGVSILAQANAAPQLVLSLLQ
ncbi:MAG: flagellin [Pseudomonadaceae bacterium]|nr:flagellin [Pseudomonadaceae bacterium]